MLAGLRALIQTRHGPGAIDLLGNDALGPKPEHDRTMPGDVLVEQDASLSIARCLPVQQWRLRRSLPLCAIKSKA
jgi:hypothetical protein